MRFSRSGVESIGLAREVAKTRVKVRPTVRRALYAFVPRLSHTYFTVRDPIAAKRRAEIRHSGVHFRILTRRPPVWAIHERCA
jgi:hypothetical protein